MYLVCTGEKEDSTMINDIPPAAILLVAGLLFIIAGLVIRWLERRK